MYEAGKDAVTEIMRRRNVARVAYFHCDHFEPWRSPHGGVSEENAAHIVRFHEATAKIDYAHRQTLFYRCHLSPTMHERSGAVFAENTPLGFVRPTEKSIRIAQSGIGHLAAQSAHEIQVHIHHEYVTRNEKFCHLSKWGSDFFRDIDTLEMDRKRFDLLVELSLETIRRETVLPLAEWFFVHGNWGLNGGDANVCTIDNELLMLQQHGCIGDFTFPAPTEEPHAEANPSYTVPMMVTPFEGAKCYDRAEAKLEPAGLKAREPSQFFVWASPLPLQTSLDYFAPPVVRCCEDPQNWARDMAELAPVIGDTLYVKTYAHAMNMKYTVDGKTIFPHEFGPIRDMFGMLFDGAIAAGATVDFLSASEVVEQITGRTRTAKEDAA